jgi:hypothetical protein
VGSAGIGGWGVYLPITVAAAVLGCYIIAGGRGDVLHSANTSQYIIQLLKFYSYVTAVNYYVCKFYAVLSIAFIGV